MKGIHGLCTLLVLSSTIRVCHTLDNQVDCEIEEGSTFLECNEGAGPGIIKNGSLIPHNTKCLQEVDTNIVPVRCQNGVVIYSASKGISQKGHRRTKRGAGHWVGAVLGGAAAGTVVLGPIGTVLGAAIGALSCLVWCPKAPKLPPKIVTKAHLEGGITSPIWADMGTTKAIVKWKATEFEGKVKVETQSKFVSGNYFEEGSYLIIYRGTNSDSLSTSDYLQFEVKVHRCSSPGWPRNGRLDCDRNGIIYGTICTVLCNGGYVVETSKPKLTCQLSNTWSPLKVPNCKPRNCDPVPVMANGIIECRDNKVIYDNICEAVCIPGYQIQGSRLMQCTTEGKWGQAPKCLDVKPPEFKKGECPNEIQFYIDSTNNTAKVTWEIPEGVDNSGDAPIITETHGYVPGQRFEAGSHTVRYTIKDKAGNQGGSCMFTIQVLTISCSPPKLNVTGGEHLNYDCPDAYMLGAKCTLSCRSGYPKSGADIIRCLSDPDIYPPQPEWLWKNGSLAPFCKETNCSMDALDSPDNGALACSEWTHGQMCQMQCQKGYDIPNIGDGLFVCGRSTGKWRPSSRVPDCDLQKDITHMNLPNEFYYYSGQCNSSEQNLLHIRENFVNALNTSKFLEECVGVPECQAKFVDVICGPVTSRRKRSSYGDSRIKRSAKGNVYSLRFELILPFKTEAGKTSDDVFTTNEEMFSKMSDAIQLEVESGHFDLHIADLHVANDSYDPGNPVMTCSIGTIPRMETGTCVGCPKGQFSDRGRCRDCPLGKYQNSTNTVACTPCPEGSNTTEAGASSIEQCLGNCPEGEYSPTGLSPCTKCASNSYQNESKSTTCQMCDQDTISKTNGATSKSECLAYDIEVQEEAVAVLKTRHELDVTSVYMWVYLRNKNVSNASLQISNTDGDAKITLMLTPMVVVKDNGTQIALNKSIASTTWTNVVVSIHKLIGRVQIYISGKLVFDDLTFGISRNDTSGLQDIITIHGGITISGFKVVLGAPTVSEISTWSSTCTPSMPNATITMDDLANVEHITKTIPSKCDAVNECDSSPCGNHTCIDKLGDYECRCLNGYSGRHCETPPDWCKENLCRNGAMCVQESNNYTCDCMFGFKGRYCETKAVDGQWSDWTTWSSCSVSCGGGNQTRTRQCDSPSEDPEGKPCPGNNSETTTCNVNDCPECSRLRITEGLRITCEETVYIQRCSISCKPGLYFDDEPLAYYECGQITGYNWTHQTEENPTARLPSCSEIQPPVQLSVSFHSAYDTIQCTVDGIAGAKQALEEKLSTVDCAQNGLCEATIHEPVCNARRRKRDASDTLRMTIELHSAVNATKESLNIQSTLQNMSEPSSDLIKFLNTSLYLEKSAQDIFNNSDDFFTLAFDGKNHSMVEGYNVTFDRELGCQSGTVPVNVFCAECPVGCYCDGKRSTMCPRGQFQDETSQSVCKMCPHGKTTDGVGSIDIAECTVDVTSGDKNEDTDKESRDIDNGIKIAIGVSVSIALLTFSVVGLLLIRNNLKRRRMSVNDTSANVKWSSQHPYVQVDKNR